MKHGFQNCMPKSHVPVHFVTRDREKKLNGRNGVYLINIDCTLEVTVVCTDVLLALWH